MWIGLLIQDRADPKNDRLLDVIRAVLTVVGLALILGCSSEVKESREGRVALSELERSLALRAEDPRPSVVLIVIDTLRADAVSSYSDVEGTTPTLDRLAAKGLRYTRAYAPSPWTGPSHASLFSGLRVDEHGVGLNGLYVTAESVQMLAEDFGEAGYLTAAFAENTLVAKEFGFGQGFDVFESASMLEMLEAAQAGQPRPTFELKARLREWNQLRDKSQPFFLFINIMDAHDPYLVRDVNPWLPASVRRDEAEFLLARYPPHSSLCDGVPSKEHLEILHQLYLGNVLAADRKLAALLEIIDQDGDLASHLLITTSDHGEHFGENRLMMHRFSVRNPVLHIPLIVTGLPDVPPAIIDHPVGLQEIRESLHCWALGENCPADLPTSHTPSGDDAALSQPIFSMFSDSVVDRPQGFRGRREKNSKDESRSKCTADDRVFGDMVSMIRYPMKMTWFENYDPVLHDLSWDPDERFDQLERQPELAQEFREELEAFVKQNLIDRDNENIPEISEEAIQMFKILGYIE